MTVEELIAELQTHPPNYTVRLLGCGFGESPDEIFDVDEVECFPDIKEVCINIGIKL